MRSLLSFAALFSVVQALSTPGLLGRASQDTCQYLQGPVRIQVPLYGTFIISPVATCLCVSQIPAFLTSNNYVRAAVQLSGRTAALNGITALVTNGGEQCSYPDNSVPQCRIDNPCGTTCTNGFTGDDCTCASPNQVCNGVCTDAPSCPSTIVPERRAHNSWQKRAACDVGFTACGTTGSYRKTIGAYECVDTKTDLESCGGCNIPLNRYSPIGQDCTAIPGVADVSCYNGACKIYECMPGYTLSPDQGACHSEDQLRILKELMKNPYKMAIDLV